MCEIYACVPRMASNYSNYIQKRGLFRGLFRQDKDKDKKRPQNEQGARKVLIIKSYHCGGSVPRVGRL